MKRLLINLPFIALFFCAGHWRELPWLESLAFAAGLLLVCLAGLACVASLLMDTGERRAFIAEEWPNGRQRLLSTNLSVCLGVCLAIAGFPIMAALYGVFAVLTFAALYHTPKEA